LKIRPLFKNRLQIIENPPSYKQGIESKQLAANKKPTTYMAVGFSLYL
jgi:hypothetical protein